MKRFPRSIALFLAPIFVWQCYLFLCVYLQDNHLPSTSELIQNYGYPVEEHKVMTEDGYLLTIFRIPHGKESLRKSQTPRPVILIQHGALASSSMFVALGPNKSIAFQLAERGYDVWLGNSRGSEYGLEHVTYNTSDPKFWDFYCEDFGLYDLSAMIDYILHLTNSDKLAFMGHSLGGAEPLVLTSKRPEYNEKISIIMGVAPGAFVNNTRTRSLEFMVKVVGPWSLKLGGNGAMLGSVFPAIRSIFPYCTPELFSSVLCLVIYNLSGTSAHLNPKDLPLAIATSVTSTSRKSVAHMAQCHYTGNFHSWINEETSEIKEYPLHLITTPVVLFYSDEDLIINPVNVIRLCNELPTCKFAYRVPANNFNHIDFFYAETAPELFYKEVFRSLDEVVKTGIP